MTFRRLASSASIAAMLFAGVGVGASAPAASATTAKPAVYLLACPGGGRGVQYRPRVKPRMIVMACADYNNLIERAVWKHWGDMSASTTSAQWWMNDCTPSCAEGTFHHEAARARVTRIVRRSGRNFYTRLRVVAIAPNPLGFRPYTYDLPA